MLPDLATFIREGELFFGYSSKARTPYLVVAHFCTQLDKLLRDGHLAMGKRSHCNLLKEAEKLFCQPITIWTPHQVQALVNSKGTEWVSPEGQFYFRLYFWTMNWLPQISVTHQTLPLCYQQKWGPCCMIL